MRVRALDSNLDYTIGQGKQNFLVNSAAAVAQNVGTALKLIRGEWFLDLTAGVPWFTKIIGHNTGSLYDAEIRSAIENVQGVLSIVSYSSTLNPSTRKLSVSA